MGNVVQFGLWGRKDMIVDEASRFKLPKRDNLNVEEVAAYLRVSGQTIRRWIDDGSLRAFKKEKTIWIPKNSLRRFLRSCSTDHVTVDEFNSRRAAIAKIKQAIRQNLPADLPENEKKKIASTIYNSLKNELRDVGDNL
jgi:excisionase family DNA binding protein